MEFRSLEEFDRAFLAKYGAAGNIYGAAENGAFSGAPPAVYDPFLREAAPSPEEASGPKESNPLQLVSSVVSYVVIALLALGIIAFVAPLPFGVKLLNVTSGSMQPDYPVNSLLWVVPTKYEKIRVGNDVAYKLPTGQNSTHRVISIDRENNMLTVQGIHNSKFPEDILYSQVQGVVRFHVHGIGNLLERFNGRQGIYLTAAIILGILLLWLGAFLVSKLKAGQLFPQRKDTRIQG